MRIYLSNLLRDSTIIDAEPNEHRAEMKRELFFRDALDVLKPGVQ
jgi:hypothetical protein